MTATGSHRLRVIGENPGGESDTENVAAAKELASSRKTLLASNANSSNKEPSEADGVLD